ncbi:MAG TPA: MG2 domain-containing protein, partial [Thermoanaerobaculia bacterium]|nr:MG2 domain-containing protein [Thermoanaerobaculia bacterium]
MNLPAALLSFIRKIGNVLLLVLRSLFGSLHWNPPGWLHFLRRQLAALVAWARGNPRAATSRALIALLVLGAAFGGTYWYRHRPKPVEIALKAIAPELTKLDENEKWKVFPLVIEFDGSVAPLDKVGKVLTRGPEISPAIDGLWKWDDDHHLSFKPKTDWPVGQSFTINIPKRGLVAAHIKLAAYELTFASASFDASVSAAEFYQDPTDPNLKKVVATITFTHPADVADLEKHLNLHMESAAPGLFGTAPQSDKYTVTYDKFKLNAYVHSAPIPIPLKDTSMVITIDAGIHSARGGQPTDKKIERQVSVPGLYSFLRVNSAALSLVDNERNEPEQVLVLETTTGVAEKDMNRSVNAFVLPVHNPDKKLDDGRFAYAWHDTTKIGPEILKISEALALDAIPAEKDFTSLHSFKYKADVGRYVYVRVTKGIKSFGGYVLGETWDSIQRVPEFPRQLRILSQGALLSMSGEKKVPLYARDVDAVRFEVGRVLPNQLQHLVSQTSGDFRRPDFSNYNFSQDNISERFTEIRELAKLPHGKSQYISFDFTKYLDVGGADRRGVFFFTAEGYDPLTKSATAGKDSRLIVVTDLGLLVKDALDGTHDVFVQSIARGEPVAGVAVQVIGSNGMGVLSATTGEDGHVQFPKLTNFKREQTPVLYLARKGNDTSFIPCDRRERRLDMSRFDVGGVANAATADRLSAYLFSDRGIYRPGDEFHIGIVVKPSDWSQNIEGVPVEAVVTDARGLVVKREKMRLSPSGFEESRYTTQDTSPTGTYTVDLYIVKDNQAAGLLGSTTVRIQEFLPDRLKISTHFSREVVSGWVSPEDLKGLVTLRNLFGTPAAGRRIAASITLSPAYPAFSAYGNYSFYDPMRAKDTFNEDLKDARTDDNADATLHLNL